MIDVRAAWGYHVSGFVSTGEGRVVTWVRCAVVAVLLFAGSALAFPVSAATCSVRQMYVVAHEDDSLLFQSPDLLRAVRSGACVTTVYLTAGDAGRGSPYWSAREAGANAAYATMAGVSNGWTRGTITVAGHSVVSYRASGAPTLTQVFLRLPDGNGSGSGFSRYGYESLQKLWTGAISRMHPVDGSAAYTAPGLTRTLVALMASQQVTAIRAHDYVGGFGGGDHSDHYASAYFARAAHRQYATPHTFTGYQGYATSSRAQNVFGDDLTRKQDAFYAYARYDLSVCGSATACAGTLTAAWLRRQYVVGSESGPTGNRARSATASASSENLSTGQTAAKAIDGIVAGYPGDYTREWATVRGGAGSWLRLTWASAVTVRRVVLYDRPNTSDQITAATLRFDDGTSIRVGTLPNNGSPLTVAVPDVTTRGVTLTVNGVSGTTKNTGLAEIEVWG